MVGTPHILIIGEGVTGLSTAWHLTNGIRLPATSRITLIEKGKYPGGRMLTRYYEPDTILENGPRVFSTTPGSSLHSIIESNFSYRGSVRKVPASFMRGIEGDVRFKQKTYWESKTGFGGETGFLEGIRADIVRFGALNFKHQKAVRFFNGIQVASPTPSIFGPLLPRPAGGVKIPPHIFPPDLPVTTMVQALILPTIKTLVDPSVKAKLPSIFYESTYSIMMPKIRPSLPEDDTIPINQVKALPPHLTSTGIAPSKFPSYWENPIPGIASIHRGHSSGNGKGLTININLSSMPSIPFNSNKSPLEDPLFIADVIERLHTSKTDIFSEKCLEEITETLLKPSGVDTYMIKKWRYSQPILEDGQGDDLPKEHISLRDGSVILTGDWVGDKNMHGVERAWEAGRMAAEDITKRFDF